MIDISGTLQTLLATDQLKNSGLARQQSAQRLGSDMATASVNRDINKQQLSMLRQQELLNSQNAEKTSRTTEVIKQAILSEGSRLGLPPEQVNAMAAMVDQDSKQAAGILDHFGLKSDSQKKEMVNFVGSVIKLPLDQQDQAIRSRIEILESQGLDSSSAISLLKDSPEERKGVYLALAAALGSEQKHAQRTNISTDQNGDQYLTTVYRDGTYERQKIASDVAQTPQEEANMQVTTSRLIGEEATTQKQQQEKNKQLELRRSDMIRDINKNATIARNQVPKLKTLLKSIDYLKTGKLAEFKATVGPYIPFINTAKEEVFLAQVNGIVMDTLKNMPGSLSNEELDFARSIQASLGKDVEANKELIIRSINTLESAVDKQNKFKEFEGNPEDFIYEGMQPAIEVNNLTKFDRLLSNEEILNLNDEDGRAYLAWLDSQT